MASKLRPDLPLAAAPVPAVHRSAPRARKLIRSHVGEAATTLGALEPGCELFAVTNGQFSMIDVLEHVLDHAGDAEIDLATWTAADGDLRRAHAFLLSGRVRRIRMLVDPSFKSRKPEFCETLVALFGQDAIRTVPLHGKFALVRGDRQFAIRSSMNLTPNRRIETVEISEDAALVSFMRGLVDEIFARSPDANFTSQSERINETSARGELPRLAF
jgi:hypothetical protein